MFCAIRPPGETCRGHPPSDRPLLAQCDSVASSRSERPSWFHKAARECALWALKQPLILVDVPNHVILFSTDACAFCVHAKSLLMKRDVAFEEVNLGEHPELQAELIAVTGLTSFPQIIVDGETLGGLNELRAADKSGTLASWSAG
ncbi:MAG: glutaredoxin [Thermoleophilaceae bacterium]|jgi:glutaredoxin 3|nr:glutaredoxin [Thermoleophilaceae bacterium]